MARNREIFNRLDQCLRERMQAYHTPALVMALTDRSKQIHFFANGYANLDTKAEIRPDDLFAIGSVGKSFTAIAALQASEAGLLDLHAPVKTYLPWFEVKSPYPSITVHHLLTHSSGLPRGTDISPDPRSEVFSLREQEVGFAPGKHFWYSDTGYKTLGLVLQAATGRSYADLVREKILEPLEMDNTFAVITSELRPRMAVGYRGLYDDRPTHSCHPLVPAAWVETDSGDGCIVSCGEDMAKYARMLLNGGRGPHGRLLSDGNWQKLVRAMVEDEGEMYGYGMYLFDDEDGNRVAGHGGDVPGYEAYIWLDLDNGLGTVVLSSQPYPPRASFLALEFFRAAALGLDLPDTPPLPDFTHISSPEDYAGEYLSETCTLKLEADNHHLILVCGEDRALLEQRAFDSFYTNHPNWDRYPLRIGRSADGQVVEVFYGPQWFAGSTYQGPTQFITPPEWEAYTGHYRAHNPWATNFRVFARKGQLILCEPSGDEEILVPLSDGCFRIGEDDYIPERLIFDQMVNGQALRAERSGCPYFRFFTP